jgi:fused signal recognition particle receptor
VRVFKGATGADSAGLCYDGLSAALKEGDDIVFIDTAGRLQNKSGLMDELKKIVRVIQKIMPDAPHKILLTLDATTGQNAVEQVKIFKELIGVNGLIVTKLDGSSKGGILVAIIKETGLPVYFIGVGEKTEDLDRFKAHDYARNLLGIK